MRRVGLELGLPEAMVWRQPFPGPGLAVRIIGEVTQERIEIVRNADAVVRDEIRRAGLERELWQVLRGAPGDPLGRGHGRRAHLRVPDRRARGHLGGCDDGRLGAPAARAARADLVAGS